MHPNAMQKDARILNVPSRSLLSSNLFASSIHPNNASIVTSSTEENLKPFFSDALSTAIVKGPNFKISTDVNKDSRNICQVYPLFGLHEQDLKEVGLTAGDKLKAICDGKYLMRAIFTSQAINALAQGQPTGNIDKLILWEIGLVVLNRFHIVYFPTRQTELGEFVVVVDNFTFLRASYKMQLSLQACPWFYERNIVRDYLRVFSKDPEGVVKKRAGSFQELLRSRDATDYLVITADQLEKLSGKAAQSEEKEIEKRIKQLKKTTLLGIPQKEKPENESFTPDQRKAAQSEEKRIKQLKKTTLIRTPQKEKPENESFTPDRNTPIHEAFCHWEGFSQNSTERLSTFLFSCEVSNINGTTNS